MGPNLNVAPMVEEEMEIDLNQPEQQMLEDPLEVIVNPAQPVQDFIELNDLLDNNVEEVAIAMENEQHQGIQPNGQQHGMQVDLNLLAVEENLMQLADQDMQHIQVNVLPEEFDPKELMNEDEMLGKNENHRGPFHIDNINLDELLGPGEPGFPEQHQFMIEQDNGQLNSQVDEQAGPDQLPTEQENLNIQQAGHAGQVFMEEGQEAPENQAHHLNVGLALIHTPEADPVWMERARTAEATRLWAFFFAKGNNEGLHISIPSQWANFFTVMLINPDLFE